MAASSYSSDVLQRYYGRIQDEAIQSLPLEKPETDLHGQRSVPGHPSENRAMMFLKMAMFRAMMFLAIVFLTMAMAVAMFLDMVFLTMAMAMAMVVVMFLAIVP